MLKPILGRSVSLFRIEDAAQVLGLNDPKGASGKASSVQVLLPTPRRPKRKKSRAGRPSVGDTALP